MMEKEHAFKFFRVSELLASGLNKKFSKIIAESYALTDWINDDYPRYCELFYGKFVPGIFNGTREFISCYMGDKIVAVAFLKKDKTEAKISTLYVKPEYQRRGVATILIEKSFEWLGTTTPLITIADYKLEQFSGIIEKYCWTETQVLESGYYNNHSREHVFNGIIKSD